MPILYGLVGRGTTVLAESSRVPGNSGAVARTILEKLPLRSEPRLCFLDDGYTFHILRSDGHTFLCMANRNFGRRIPFLYLEDVRVRFMNNYGEVAPYAPPYAMNDQFSRVLHHQMDFFSTNATMTRVTTEFGELRTIVVDNIEKIIDRGGRIVLLVDNTPTVQGSGFDFRNQPRRLRRAMRRKNTRLLASLTCLIVLLLFIIIAASCGGVRLHSCRFHHHIL